MARYRELAAAGGNDGGAEMRDAEELTGDKKKILDKLMDQDEEEPEVRGIIWELQKDCDIILLIFLKLKMKSRDLSQTVHTKSASC